MEYWIAARTTVDLDLDIGLEVRGPIFAKPHQLFGSTGNIA